MIGVMLSFVAVASAAEPGLAKNPSAEETSGRQGLSTLLALAILMVMVFPVQHWLSCSKSVSFMKGQHRCTAKHCYGPRSSISGVFLLLILAAFPGLLQAESCALKRYAKTSSLAGSGSEAFADGTGTAASFSSPYGVSWSPDGTRIAVADLRNNRFRMAIASGCAAGSC